VLAIYYCGGAHFGCGPNTYNFPILSPSSTKVEQRVEKLGFRVRVSVLAIFTKEIPFDIIGLMPAVGFELTTMRNPL